MSIEAAFVRSAARRSDFPRDGLPELALVGRSNVGKSSLINALLRRSIARTSGAPGKTRLVNLYRVTNAPVAPFYLVDLPGYGYARREAPPKGVPPTPPARSFEALTTEYFESRVPGAGPGAPLVAAVLLLVDARHPGLPNDLGAWAWLTALARPAAVAATKIDKLTRAERARARQALDLAFNGPVLPVSAQTGEGLKELWRLIERLLSSPPGPTPPRR